MKKVTGSLGRYYPFFLTNSDLRTAHYLYQLYSPKVDEKTLVPFVSLTKVSEKTSEIPNLPDGSDLDIIRVCIGRKQITEQEAAEYLDTVAKRVWGKMHFDNGSDKLPYVEILDNQFHQRTLISVLRDSLRWKIYRYFPGRFIDVLWTKDEFTVLEICEDETTIYLKPLNVLYKNTDTNLSDPHPYNLEENGFVTEHWDKTKPMRASEINKYIRNLEWNSFSRKSVF